MKRWIGCLGLLAACGGPNEETLIDELRVVAMVTEPAEAAPGDTVEISVLTSVADDTAPEQITWSCLPTGDRCLEAEAGTLENWVHQGTLDEAGSTAYSIELPPELAAFLPEEEALSIPLWTLSCAPGLCPLFAQVESSPDANAPGWDALMAALADPVSEMVDLPKEGVSLAFRSMVISNRAPEERNQNPVLSAESSDPVSVGAEESIELQFSLEDDGESLQAFGYTTMGGFDSVGKEVEAGGFDLTLFGPAEMPEGDPEGRVYVVVNDGQGGTAFWTQTLTIAAP